MGTSTNAHHLATKLLAAGAGVSVAADKAVAEAAVLIKGAVAVASGRYAGSDLAQVLIAATKAGALVAMTNRKAHLLDHDTKAHEISPRRAGALNLPSHPVTGTVEHPGTHGKLMWEKGVAAARPAVVATVDARVGAALVKAFA